MDSVIYRIDPEDRLIEMSAVWDRFAIENNAPALVAKNIEGRPLRDFITDPQTWLFHRLLIERVRNTGAAIANLPFRCDSPDKKRFMTMSLIPLARGIIEYQCECVRVVERIPVAVHHIAAGSESADMLRMCSWCNRIDCNEWLEIEDAVTKTKLLAREEIPFVTHTICPACVNITTRFR